jgi:hypothetical protein
MRRNGQYQPDCVHRSDSLIAWIPIPGIQSRFDARVCARPHLGAPFGGPWLSVARSWAPQLIVVRVDAGKLAASQSVDLKSRPACDVGS